MDPDQRGPGKCLSRAFASVAAGVAFFSPWRLRIGEGRANVSVGMDAASTRHAVRFQRRFGAAFPNPSPGFKLSTVMETRSEQKHAGWSDWLGLIRFSHTIFALPFAALAFAMALAAPLPDGVQPRFRWQDAIGVLLCMVFARSAAMAFNRLVDHRIDADNPRTAGRHLPAGVLSRQAVIWFTLGCSVGFIASTLLFWPNPIPLVAAIPVLLFLCGYSLAKRFTFAAHLWLGVALSLSPICVWLAVRGMAAITYPGDLWSPLLLAAAVAAWVTGFDIIYACQDADFDSGAGLHSIPARFGVAGALKIAAICHLGMLALLAILPLFAGSTGLGTPFWVVLVLVALLVVRQHRLVKPDDLERVNQAFFDTNAAISVALLVIGTLDCWIF